jgi:hypothetical protein
VRRFLIAISAMLLLAAAVPRARADEDRVSFFHDITISEGDQTKDLVCILCSIRNDGEVHGDVVALLGSIHSNGSISGDTVTILGNINLGTDARIGGDCVAVLGDIGHHTSNQIGRDAVQLPLILLLIPALFLFALVYGIRALVGRARGPYPMPPPPPMR